MDGVSESIKLSAYAVLWLQNQNNQEQSDILWEALSPTEKILFNSIKEKHQTLDNLLEEQKKINLELEKSLSFFQAAINELNLPICIKDSFAKYTFVNDEFLNIFNTTEDDLIKKIATETNILNNESQEEIYKEDLNLIETLSNTQRVVNITTNGEAEKCWYWATGFIDNFDNRGQIGTFTNIASLLEQHDELKSQVVKLSSEKKQTDLLAMTDPLTGLYNKLSMDIHMNRLVKGKELYDTSFCALMFDIDHFKLVNDNYGHLEGDEVLKNTGKFILDTTRKVDICIRYGGEEFLVLLPGTSLDNATIFAKRLCQVFPDKIVKSDSTPVTISIGLTEYVKGESTKDLIRRADLLLYSAKKNGRNQVKIGK